MPETLSVQDFIRREAKTAGVPEELALAIAEQESGFNPTVEGPEISVGGQRVRARGTFQLLPSTAQMLKVDPDDPVQNIRGGVTYLRQLLDRHDGDLNKVLAEYGGVKTDTKYVPSVVKRLQKYQSGTPRTAITKGELPPEALGIAPPTFPSGGAKPPTIGAPPPVADPTFSERHPVISALASGIDPRTPTGRRNIAGGVGAALGTAAVVGTAPVSLPILGMGATAAGVLGATGGGILAESGEQLVGTKPPSSTAILGAGAEQGALEAGGQVAGAAVRGVGKRIASTVAGKRAIEGFRNMVTTRPSAEAAGDAVQSLVRSGSRTEAEGAAHLAKSNIGRRVQEAAESGPDVVVTPLKEEAERILGQLQEGQRAFPATPPGPPTTYDLSKMPRNTAKERSMAAAADAAVEAEKARVDGIVKHPAMAVVGRILNAPDTVSFAEAHAFKKELDDALKSVWDKSGNSKKTVESLTQHLRTTLRGTLESAGHLPYETATKEYAEIAPLFYKGYVPKLQKIAQEEPAALIGMIQGNKPRAARRLKEVLTVRAEEGGGAEGAAAGKSAWDNVRSAWTREKLIKGSGGLPQLGARIEQMDPDFVAAFYDDAHGQQILHNLQSIVVAYKASPLTQPRHGDVLPDVLRATFLGPGSIWGALSVERLLKGPKSTDLLDWAMKDTKRTQAVIHALVGPKIPEAMANLVRMLPPAIMGKGILETVGTPPPRAQGAGPNARRDTSGMVGAPPP